MPENAPATSVPVTDDVPFVPAGVKAAVEFVPAGVNAAVLFVPVAVTVWRCVASWLPVNVSAGTVRFGAVVLHALSEPVPAAIAVDAQLPVVAVAPFVPAGVPAVTALVFADEHVKVSAGTVPAFPVKV